MPLLVLVGGTIFTALLYGLARRAETVKQLVRLRTHELARSESQYRLLAENATDLICRVGLDGTRLHVSPASRQLLGYGPKELVGHSFLKTNDQDFKEHIQRQFGDVAAGTVDTASISRRERHTDGRWLWLEDSLRLVRDANERPVEIVTISRDVTMREIAAQQLRDARDEAEQAKTQAESASEAKTDFLATMSHEIRTPLNSVIGFTGIILDRSDLDAEPKRQMHLIQRSGVALLTVVEDILDFSKIEAGEVTFEERPFALAAFIDDAVSIIHDSAAEKGPTLKVTRSCDQTEWFLGDQSRLMQVLLNLLHNAIKFTVRGQIELSVTVDDSDGQHADLRFSVRDTGIGIALEQQPFLFERFFQAEGSTQRRYEGAGLGLAICKRLIELTGGQLGVESEEGVGSTFWFNVTLQKSAQVEVAEIMAPQEVALESADILLVEDLEINREIAATILRNAGHHVDMVDDGEAAVNAVREHRYDIVLMDIQMPGVDGVTAARRTRELPGPESTVPVIAVTANVLPDQIARFKAAGMDDHIGKPLNKRKLLEAIERWTSSEAGDDQPASVTSSTQLPDFDKAVFDELYQAFEPDRIRHFNAIMNDMISQALSASDPDAATERVHKVISIAELLGCTRLSELAHQLEVAFQNDQDTADLRTEFEDASRIGNRKLSEVV